MASYQIEWRNSTRREIRRIDRSMIPRILEAVESLANEPRPIGCKKMQGSECAYRIRIGNYRVIYEIFDDKVIIEVIRVGHRRDIYE